MGTAGTGGHTFSYVSVGEAGGVEWTHLSRVFLGSLGCRVEDRRGQWWQGNQGACCVRQRGGEAGGARMESEDRDTGLSQREENWDSV